MSGEDSKPAVDECLVLMNYFDIELLKSNFDTKTSTEIDMLIA